MKSKNKYNIYKYIYIFIYINYIYLKIIYYLNYIDNNINDSTGIGPGSYDPNY